MLLSLLSSMKLMYLCNFDLFDTGTIFGGKPWGRLVCQLKTQCSVFKHWTPVSKWQKYMFGLSVENAVVWKLLLKNQCLNNMFWNVARGDFKQWTHVSDGDYVINLNTFTQLFWLLMDPLISFFFFKFCLLSSV